MSSTPPHEPQFNSPSPGAQEEERLSVSQFEGLYVGGLAQAPPPLAPPQEMGPDQLETYVRSAMHHDRTPGTVLAIIHPLRLFKVPRGLLEALGEAGCEVRTVETQRDRIQSVEGIRDAILAASELGRPLDLLVVSGDGTLDHHVMVAAFLAFYPDLVKARAGEIRVDDIPPEELASIPLRYRGAFLSPMPTGGEIEPTHQNIVELWLLRAAIEGLLSRDRSVERIVRRVRMDSSDPRLRLMVLATFLPHRVTLRAHGFDLSGLVNSSQEETFKGLFPFIRSICFFPAGTAADNAVFAGAPGWIYAQASKILTRFAFLDGVRRRWERSVVKSFVEFFLKESVVVPERLSVVGFDGDWQVLSSHVAGGPGAGRFFTADLTSHTGSMLGYLKRLPWVILQEGVFGSTVVRVVSRFADGRRKSFTESKLAEGLYTNRTFIAGVGSIPTTAPTSFAGQSSLLVVPPIFSRDSRGKVVVNLRGLITVGEGILKGVAARTLHILGLRVGTLAAGGKIASLLPENQVAIKEGEEIDIHYMTMDKRPRAVPVQVSGDPFQAWRMSIRSSWAPIPVLGQEHSLLLSTTRSTLANLRLQQTYHLREEFIGGVHYFWHHLGEEWSQAFQQKRGLFRPPRYLPPTLSLAQRRLMEDWKELGTGDFVDTTESGLSLGRRGRYAHNNDQTAHLVVLKEPRATLLVRQIRAAPEGGCVYENRTHYRSVGAVYIIFHSQTIAWEGEGPPRIVQEDHFFRNAEEFQREAPSYFPVLGTAPQSATLLSDQLRRED